MSATRCPPPTPRVAARQAGRAAPAPRRERLNRDSGCGASCSIDRPASRSIAQKPAGGHRPVARVGGRAAGARPGTDLDSLVVARDYTTRATGVRHLLLRQRLDSHTVFDPAIAIHIAPNNRVLRITANAAAGDGRTTTPTVGEPTASMAAVQHAGGTAATANSSGCRLTGELRLAWHAVVADEHQRHSVDV